MSGGGGGAPARRAALRALLLEGGEGATHTQHQLRAALRRRGFDVDQSTVSRDLRAIAARRETVPEGPPRWSLGDGGALPSPSGRPFPTDLVLGVASNAQIVLVRTRVASASTVASALDHAHVPGVLGTLAGDDTIFVAPARGVSTATLERRVRAVVLG